MTTRTPFLIGISYASRAGKDTAAEALCRDLGFVRVGFADKLKELALACDPIVTHGAAQVNRLDNTKLNWIVKGMGGWEKAKDTYPEVRRFLENLGTGCRDVFGADFWVDQLLAGVDSDRVVVADVRFANEAEAIRAKGGKIIKINRPGFPARPFERELEDYDFDEVFENDRGIVELQATVVAWVKNQIQVAERKPTIVEAAGLSGQPLYNPEGTTGLVVRGEPLLFTSPVPSPSPEVLAKIIHPDVVVLNADTGEPVEPVTELVTA